jgi:hypothetical protein
MSDQPMGGPLVGERGADTAAHARVGRARCGGHPATLDALAGIAALSCLFQV